MTARANIWHLLSSALAGSRGYSAEASRPPTRQSLRDAAQVPPLEGAEEAGFWAAARHGRPGGAGAAGTRSPPGRCRRCPALSVGHLRMPHRTHYHHDEEPPPSPQAPSSPPLPCRPRCRGSTLYLYDCTSLTPTRWRQSRLPLSPLAAISFHPLVALSTHPAIPCFAASVTRVALAASCAPGVVSMSAGWMTLPCRNVCGR